MTSRSALVWVVAILALAAHWGGFARAEPPKHKGDFFSDYSGQVPPLEAEEIDRTLQKASIDSGIHCVLVVVQRMSDHAGMPTNARDFAYELAKAWKVGNARNGKGLLILFSLGDKKFHAVKTKNLPVSLTDQIARSMKGGVTLDLGDGQVASAMKKAAENIAAHVPAETTSVSAPVPGETPAGGKQQFTPISRTSSGSPSRQQVQYDKQTRSSGSWGWVILVVGGIILVIIIISVAGAFGAARRYGTGYGGYGPGYGYGGYGYGGYGGGGDMLTGMMLGGMMGNMFGGGGRSVEHHYHGSAPSSGFDMGSSGSGFGSWGGGDSSGGSWGSTSFDGGGFSSFGGGDFGGGSSGGEW